MLESVHFWNPRLGSHKPKPMEVEVRAEYLRAKVERLGSTKT
jgi:hypothetical protein